MGRTKKKEEKKINTKNNKEIVNSIKNENTSTEKEVSKESKDENVSLEVDTLNVEKEQEEFAEKENLDVNDVSEKNDEDTQISVKEAIHNVIEPISSHEKTVNHPKEKKRIPTTNEMFGYQWMGQIYFE